MYFPNWTPGHRDIGTIGHRDTRTLGHQDSGTAGHWDTKHWDTGWSMEYWCPVPTYCNSAVGQVENATYRVKSSHSAPKNSRHIKKQKKCEDCKQYQPSVSGGTHSPPATPHCLQNPKWPPGGPAWPMVPGKVFGCFKQLSLNNFFDPKTPCSFWWLTILGG